jgi:hypothetical protein
LGGIGSSVTTVALGNGVANADDEVAVIVADIVTPSVIFATADKDDSCQTAKDD